MLGHSGNACSFKMQLALPLFVGIWLFTSTGSAAAFPRTVAHAVGRANSSVYGMVVLVGDAALDGFGSTKGSVETTLAAELGTTIINNAVGGADLDEVYNSQPSCSCYSSCKWSVITAGMTRNTGGSRTMLSFIARELAAGKQVLIQGHPTPVENIPMQYMTFMESYATLANGHAHVWFSDPRSQEFWKFPAFPGATHAEQYPYHAPDRFHPSALGGSEMAKSMAAIIRANSMSSGTPHESSSSAHCANAHGAGSLAQGHGLNIYADPFCKSLVNSIRVGADFCQKSQLECMAPLDLLNSKGVVQKQTSIRYRIASPKANVSQFDLEWYWNAGCHGEVGANVKTGSTLETKELFTYKCATAYEYPTSKPVYLRFEDLPADCFFYHGSLMVTTTTTTTTTTTIRPGAVCDLEGAFVHPFKLVAGRLGTHGTHEKYKYPAIGGLLNYPTDIALDLMKQTKYEPPVKTHDVNLPAHGAIAMPPKPSLTPYGPQVASYGMVVMPPEPRALPSDLKAMPDAAAIMPDGSVPDPQPFVMVPGDVKKQGPETLAYAAVVMPAGTDPQEPSYGSVVMPPGIEVTPPGAQIVSWGADVKPSGLPAMPKWAHVMPPTGVYQSPGAEAAGITVANLLLPGTRPLPLASLVEPGVPVVIPQPYDAREKREGAQQVFIADSANHAVRLVNLTTGIMNTVAGHVGKPGGSGDGGPATSAYMLNPRGLALDISGRLLYVADHGNHVIRRVELNTGIIRTVAGVLESPGSAEYEGLATSVRLSFPTALALDPSGRHLYIADSGNHVIRLFDLTLNSISTIAGTMGKPGKSGDGGPGRAAQFSTPSGLALDEASRKLYIADLNNHAVRLLDLTTGLLSTIAGTIGVRGSSEEESPDGPALVSALNQPTGLALDLSAQKLYISGSSHFAVRQLDLTPDPAGLRVIRTFNSRPGFLGASADGGPLGLAFDPIATELYVVEPFNDAVQVIDVLAKETNPGQGLTRDDPACRPADRPVQQK